MNIKTVEKNTVKNNISNSISFLEKEISSAVFQQVIKWISKNVMLNISSNTTFKRLYENYISDCEENNMISYSKRKFSTLFRHYYKNELHQGAMTIENRGGVRVFGAILKKDYDAIKNRESLESKKPNDTEKNEKRIAFQKKMRKLVVDFSVSNEDDYDEITDTFSRMLREIKSKQATSEFKTAKKAERTKV